MTYEYQCRSCDHRFDVIKSVSEMTRAEACPKCQGETDRKFVPSRFAFAGTAVEHPEYNPAFGCIVRNKSHRRELAKIHNVIEVGNTDLDRLHKKFDQDRAEKLEKSWEAI